MLTVSPYLNDIRLLERQITSQQTVMEQTISSRCRSINKRIFFW